MLLQQSYPHRFLGEVVTTSVIVVEQRRDEEPRPALSWTHLWESKIAQPIMESNATRPEEQVNGIQVLKA
jgi:hypothetical protein